MTTIMLRNWLKVQDVQICLYHLRTQVYTAHLVFMVTYWIVIITFFLCYRVTFLHTKKLESMLITIVKPLFVTRSIECKIVCRKIIMWLTIELWKWCLHTKIKVKTTMSNNISINSINGYRSIIRVTIKKNPFFVTSC